MNKDLKFILIIVVAVFVASFFYENIFAKMPLNIWLARALGAIIAGVVGLVLSKVFKLDYVDKQN
ncbi:hypothetical protein HZY91_04740 [Facklamia sp. DSM 111018]|uniref:Uncharacterized protein n=1 Tax=Facklamia lactis TaxID=2749967 RepID=A0ABS0LPW3_9LACT|nr:hypothetical protein [Facklamia lactis]MBG9986200.1 hypothetical protein [Facklamia lactis]